MTRSRTALEIKGRMLSITRVRVLDPDTAAIRAHIEQLAKQMPQAVKGMAVVIDSEFETDLPALLEAMRGVGMQPLAVSEGPLAAAAKGLGLAVVSKDSGKGAAAAPEPAKAAPQAAAPAAGPRRAARIITEPVRSGQQIYAEYGDLVVLNTVSPGAEVIADGCVHVYGKLAGRAIAGARGDEGARVFCRKLEAELIAIAGIYAVSEQIKDGPRGVSAMAYLEQGRLKIEPHKI
ncbi:septum site-determining protein MinC [Nevskia soli]|uniref:septum site-determining protein MinC n=1 Tax=Nevskia soli TaxID=418856 RepID=UPI0004A6D02A|nr:septum site-determining protein MinC [Nevskia soli]